MRKILPNSAEKSEIVREKLMLNSAGILRGAFFPFLAFLAFLLH